MYRKALDVKFLSVCVALVLVNLLSSLSMFASICLAIFPWTPMGLKYAALSVVGSLLFVSTLLTLGLFVLLTFFCGS